MKKFFKIVQTALFISVLSILFFSTKSNADYYLCTVYLDNENTKLKDDCKLIKEKKSIIYDSPTAPETEYTEYTLFPDPSPTQTISYPEPSALPNMTLLPTPIVPSNTSPLNQDISIAHPMNYVTLKNGVKLTENDVKNIKILKSPKELIKKVFTNPKEAIKAIASVGKDLPPEKRKETQQVVFPTIIVSSVIGNATNMLIRRVR